MSRYTAEGFRADAPMKQISKCALAVALGAILAGAIPAPGCMAADLHGKADLFLNRQAGMASHSGWTSVIVQLDGGLTAANQAQLTRLGADIYRHLSFVNAVAVRVPTRSLSRLAALSCVRRMSLDGAVRKTDEFTVTHSGADIALSNYGLDGTTVGVAVLDSGIHMKDDLKDPKGKPRVAAQVSFVDGDDSTNDKCGHGTHIAGIIAGNGKQSTGKDYFRTFYGVARNASLVNVRVLDDQGRGAISSVLSGLQWVVANKARYNIRVINLSLGHPVGESYTTDPLCQAVEQAWKSGIVVVCAAGNDGRLSDTAVDGVDNEGYGTNYGSIQSPGNDPYVITVGAMKQDLSKPHGRGCTGDRSNDRIATYSSRGPSRLDFVMKPDIVAPGNQVISLCANSSYLDDYAGNSNDIRQNEYKATKSLNWSAMYFRLSGTSMAAPVVAGAAALMLQQNPTLSPDTVKARLMISADKWGFNDWEWDPCTFGAGYLDIPAALNCPVVATQPALSPTVYQGYFGLSFIDLSSIWGDRAIWGTGVDDLKAIWGKRAIWGTNVLSSSIPLYGNSVWSDKALWGHNIENVDLSSRVINGE